MQYSNKVKASTNANGTMPANHFTDPATLIRWLKQLGIATLYALLLYLGEFFLERDSIVGHFDSASGLALAALLIGGKRYVWGVFLGAILINTIFASSLWAAVIIASGEALQALCGAWLLTRNGKFDLRLQSLRDYLRLILLGGSASIAIGALVVNTTLLVSGLLIAENYFYSMLKWWMGGMLGVIIITPLIVVWWQSKNGWRETGRTIEAALLLGLTILVGQIVFLDWLHDSIGLVAKGYWMFLFITWVAVRLEAHGVVIALIVVAVQGVFGAIQGTGFFANDIATTHLVNYWFYMVALSMVGMALATYFAERKQAAAEIENLAFYDPLTRLPNRRLLLDRLKQALASSTRSGREGALLFIDLDNFKTLNDTLGHDIGDLLLQQVAQRLESCIREGDTVARLGGDEFVVMLEDLSEHDLEAAAQAETVGEKILATLSRPYQLVTHEHRSTPSIGVALFSDHVQTHDELLKQADIAMYQAKKAGRNALRFFDPAMQAAVTVHVALESDLRRAILEQGQLQLYYQAQVDSSGRLTGAEALLRWRHPERGMVSPAEFIPLAEESGLILPLGHWVMATACQQLVAWAAKPETAHLTLAVNVSAKQFHLPTFVEEVTTLVDYFGVNPARLKLEITESLMLENVDDIIAKMTTLKTRGISFSMDDFGTGYSSLQYLKRLPLDQLKIDQSFVCDIADDSGKAIVRTIIAMAQSLNLSVIAEGVEMEAQRQLLLNEGCTTYQGYLFGKPVPIEQFACY